MMPWAWGRVEDPRQARGPVLSSARGGTWKRACTWTAGMISLAAMLGIGVFRARRPSGRSWGRLRPSPCCCSPPTSLSTSKVANKGRPRPPERHHHHHGHVLSKRESQVRRRFVKGARRRFKFVFRAQDEKGKYSKTPPPAPVGRDTGDGSPRRRGRSSTRAALKAPRAAQIDFGPRRHRGRRVTGVK